MKRLLALVGGLLLGSTTLAAPPTTAPTTEFIRFVENADGSARLEVADAAYARNGVTVHLISAVHIADESFFDALNESFTHYDSLLYEMVKPKDMVPMKPRKGMQSRHWVGGLQQFMKDKLELAYQMECVDYTPRNFVHADLDWETFEEKQNERGESMPGLMATAIRRQLVRNIAGQYTPTIGAMDMLNALKSPERARDLKYLLGKQMAHAEDMVELLEGDDGSVIIKDRNKAAMDVLKQRLRKGDKYIGIFYGGGHLKGMEQILQRDMGFKRIDVAWRTAWDIPKPTKPPATQPTTRSIK
jgi:hypothetical protein